MDGRRPLQRVTAICMAIFVALALRTPAAADGELQTGSTGQIAVDGVAMDDVLHDVPHVGCSFVLDFSGYDDRTRTATIQLVGQEPTGGGELVDDSFAFGNAGRVKLDLGASLADVDPDPQHG